MDGIQLSLRGDVPNTMIIRAPSDDLILSKYSIQYPGPTRQRKHKNVHMPAFGGGNGPKEP